MNKKFSFKNIVEAWHNPRGRAAILLCGYLIFLMFVVGGVRSNIKPNSNNIDKKLTILSKSIIEKFPIVRGVCANLNERKTNVIMSNNTKNIIGTDYYIEKLSEINYKISANSFFQVNPLCAELIFNKVKEIILSKVTNPTILDAYSGVSSFGIWLSSIASKVVCIEEVKSASEDARANVKLNKIVFHF